MTAEDEQDYITEITSPEHTRIANAEHERQRRQHAQLKQRGFRLRGLDNTDSREKR